MYIVRFLLKKSETSETYHYHNSTDAFYHLSLFKNDDSKLYSSIEVWKDDEKEVVLLAKMLF